MTRPVEHGLGDELHWYISLQAPTIVTIAGRFCWRRFGEGMENARPIFLARVLAADISKH
ncbi:hypothetical protein [Pararobbsia silviterrae]|nr:hypothetical protein [Pararobbsia silviterrae]